MQATNLLDPASDESVAQGIRFFGGGCQDTLGADEPARAKPANREAVRIPREAEPGAPVASLSRTWRLLGSGQGQGKDQPPALDESIKPGRGRARYAEIDVDSVRRPFWPSNARRPWTIVTFG